MHAFIFDAALTGHHALYLERICDFYLERGAVITIGIPHTDANHPCIQRIIEKGSGRTKLLPFPAAARDAAFSSSMGDVGREIALWRLIRQQHRHVDRTATIDLAFLPYADHCLYALGLLGSPFGSTPWKGICMRPAFHLKHFGIIGPSSHLNTVKKFLFLKVLRQKSLVRLFTIDELLFCYFNSRQECNQERLFYAPDPANQEPLPPPLFARNRLSLESSRFVVLVYGAIDSRKGIDVLISAVAKLVNKNITILVAGQQSLWAQNLLSNPTAMSLRRSRQLEIIDEFVPSETELLLYAASDAVWLGYRNHFTMSGVLVNAARAGKTILASDVGLIGWYVTKLNLGYTFNIDNLQSVMDALSSATVDSLQVTRRRAAVDAFSRNTWENFFLALDI